MPGAINRNLTEKCSARIFPKSPLATSLNSDDDRIRALEMGLAESIADKRGTEPEAEYTLAITLFNKARSHGRNRLSLAKGA